MATAIVRADPLPRDFFERPTEDVARDLLGVRLVRDSSAGLLIGRIVETEAYLGPGDRASHARAGLTQRTAPMFGAAGHAYVYLVYGMHHCLNVVARSDRPAGAVLIRAIEPLAGLEAMRRDRPARVTDRRLAAGPALLCQAFGIDRRLSGHDLTSGEQLWLAARAEPISEPATGPRVGVAYAGDGWAERPLRFWLAGNPAVSR